MYINAEIREWCEIEHSKCSLMYIIYDKIAILFRIPTYGGKRIVGKGVGAVKDTGKGIYNAAAMTKTIMVKMGTKVGTEVITPVWQSIFKDYDDRIDTGSWVGSHDMLVKAKKIHTLRELVHVHTLMHMHI